MFGAYENSIFINIIHAKKSGILKCKKFFLSFKKTNKSFLSALMEIKQMKAALFYYEIDIFNIYLREQYEVCRVMYTFWSSYVPTFCILLMVIARGWGILGSWQCVNYRTGRSSGLHVHPSSKSCLLPLANS